MSVKDLSIRDARQLGAVVRAVRKSQALRQDQVGRFSHSFMLGFDLGINSVARRAQRKHRARR